MNCPLQGQCVHHATTALLAFSKVHVKLKKALEEALVHDDTASHKFDGARFMVDKSLPLGMELRYELSMRNAVDIEFALPLQASAALATYIAYWPAASESARFRLLSRPLQQSENGLQSIELEPLKGNGQLVAIAPSAVDSPCFHMPSAHDSLVLLHEQQKHRRLGLLNPWFCS